MYKPKANEPNNNRINPPSKGKPGGGGGVDGGGGPGAAKTLMVGKKTAVKIITILLGRIFIVRKSKKKI